MSTTTRSTNLNKPGCRLLFGVFWLAFSSIFLIIGIVQEETAFAIFGLVFVLIGVALTAYGLFTYYTRFRIGKPEIIISEQMLRLGESFSVNLNHSVNRKVQLEGINLQLIFRETATYQQGTDTRTVVHNHTIASFEEPGGQFQAGHLIHKNFDLQIPRTGMHTLKVRRNKLEWLVRFEMKVPKLPDLVEEFELEIVPVIMR